jgi:hypothetical protein
MLSGNIALLGAIAQLALPGCLMAQVAQHAGQVLTPFGYRDSAKVHRIPPGYDLNRMDDGHIRMENAKTGDHIDFPKPDPISQATTPFSDTGWVTFASWYNSYGKPVSYFATDWTVPPPPSFYNGQTLFQFNSIEPASYDAILQPVLQYGPSAAGGGEYWAIASWFLIGNTAYVSGLEAINAGQPLAGLISLTGHSKRGGYSYSCQFYGYGDSRITVLHIPELVWCTETLEVYHVTECSQFPNTYYSQMGYINVLLKGGTVPDINWTITNAQTACSAQTTVVTDGAVNAAVNIYY